MIIRNAGIYTGNRFEKRDLVIRKGRIVDLPAEQAAPADSNGPAAEGKCKNVHPLQDEEILDASGLRAIPGLVDIHFHGAMGKDFCDASEESIQTIADFEASQGVLAICPATMTFPEEILTLVMETAACHRNGRGADLVGIHMEGPFISPHKVGSQNPLYVRKADGPMFERLQKAGGGLIRLVDVAPEEPGNLDFIRAYADQVRISVAHTCADYETAKKAYKSGAKHLTHMFNAMPDILHRDPGPILAAWEEGASAELIADGIHNYPAIVRMAFQLFGPRRLILISDSLESTGLPDGNYMLGGQSITVHGRKAVLTEKPDIIAGSSSSLFDCLKCAVTVMNIPVEQAVRAATQNPAEAIGIDADYGSLTAGHYGNVILINDAFEIVHIIQKGQNIR